MAHECRHALPCYHLPDGCYAEIKDALRAGQPITDEEAEFIGVGPSRRREGSGGWRSVSELSTFELSAADLESTDPQVLAWLTATGQREGIAFLSG